MKFNFFACVIGLVLGHIDIVCGQAVLYDNTNVPVFEGSRDWGLGVVGNKSRFVAQPFRLDEGDTLSQVTVGLSRWGNGSGTLRLSVWNESGEGIPGTLVADVGSLDVASWKIRDRSHFRC